MSGSVYRRHAPVGLLLCGAALLLAGCRVLDEPADTDASVAQSDQDASESEPTATVPPALASNAWVLRPADATAAATAPALPHWRHADAEEWLASAPDAQDQLAAELAAADPVAATNAAIFLTRQDDGRGVERLESTARDNQARLPLRLAAIEALASPSPLVRHEALLGCADVNSGPWPADADELRFDVDPRVRAAALAGIAARRHPQAEALLAEALADQDLDVRLAAIAALGTLSGEGPRLRLRQLLVDEPELVRQAAVRALAVAGDAAAVCGAAGDPGWRVRLAVADALVGLHGPQAVAVAAELVHDPSPAVQEHMVESLTAWPVAETGPLLMLALERGTYRARQAAAEGLAASWPPAAGFPTSAPAPHRADRLAELRDRWSQDFPSLPPAPEVGAVSPDDVPDNDSADQAARAEGLLASLALLPADSADRAPLLDELAAIGPPLLSIVERQWQLAQRPPDDDVIHRVLPRIDPAFGLVKTLADGELAERRAAADRLAGLAAEAPLSPLLTARLAQASIAESDAQVCRSLLIAVSADPGEPALRMATAAASHPVAEVRRRACEHLGRHGGPRNAPVVQAALADPDSNVVLAALAAVGAIGGQEAAPALERLLASPDHALRVEAAFALARIGGTEAPAAIDRLTWDADPQVRRRAAAVMGELADPIYAAALIRMLDDQPAVQLAALDSLPQVVGEDPARDSDAGLPIPDRVARWQAWWEESSELATRSAERGEDAVQR